MTTNKIKNLAELYREMEQAESDKKAKRRLSETADALEACLAVNETLEEIIGEVEELLGCGILTDECDLAKAMPRIKRGALRGANAKVSHE